MAPAAWAENILLVVGTIVALAGCIGLLCARNIFDRLHFLAPGATISAACFVLAFWIQQGWSSAAAKALIILALLVFGGSALTHATARAAWVRRFGKWEPDVARVNSPGVRPQVDPE